MSTCYNRCVSGILLAMLLALHPVLAGAEQPTPPDLPSTDMAKLAIDQDPTVIEARRMLDAASHGANALSASPHEWTAKVSAQRRSIESGGTSNEWSAALERTLRVGGKAEIDRQIGDIELEIARARIGEARHEAARALAGLWLDVLAAAQQRELWVEQMGFAAASFNAVEKRQRAGDASMLDVNVARADRFEVERQVAAATSTESKAKAKLAVRFPTLTQTLKPLAEPEPLSMTLPQWRARILDESDVIRLAVGTLKKAELVAARARADRVADPTVGIFTASEAFRRERIVGVSVSIPFSGTYRTERMQQALQDAEATRARVERQRREQEAEIVEAHAEAVGGLARWRIAVQGLTTTRDSARLTQRAYTLGEADLQTLLLARRQAVDAAAATAQARGEALRWQHRLLIDAHLIWGLADE